MPGVSGFDAASSVHHGRLCFVRNASGISDGLDTYGLPSIASRTAATVSGHNQQPRAMPVFPRITPSHCPSRSIWSVRSRPMSAVPYAQLIPNSTNARIGIGAAWYSRQISGAVNSLAGLSARCLRTTDFGTCFNPIRYGIGRSIASMSLAYLNTTLHNRR